MRNFQGFFLCSEAVVHVLFNKVSSLKACNFKKIFQRRCFTVYFATFLRTHFLQNTSGGCLCILKWSFICYFLICMAVPLTLSRMGLFQGCSRIGVSKKAPPHPKIYHIFSYNNETWHNYTLPKEFQKMYESRDRLLEFCWHQHFFTGNQQLLSYQKIQI